MNTAVLSILGLVLWTMPVLAAQAANFRGGFSGEEMLGHCAAEERDPSKDFDRGVCIGYVDGFHAGRFVGETYHAFHHRDEKLDNIYGQLCVPDTVSRGKLARVFVLFLRKNPERLKLPAALLLEDALREEFPCPNK